MDEKDIEQVLDAIVKFAKEYSGPNSEAIRETLIRAQEDETVDGEVHERRDAKERMLDALSILVGLAFPATAESLDQVLDDLSDLTDGAPLTDLIIETENRSISVREVLPIQRDGEARELLDYFTKLLQTDGSGRQIQRGLE